MLNFDYYVHYIKSRNLFRFEDLQNILVIKKSIPSCKRRFLTDLAMSHNFPFCITRQLSLRGTISDSWGINPWHRIVTYFSSRIITFTVSSLLRHLPQVTNQIMNFEGCLTFWITHSWRNFLFGVRFACWVLWDKISNVLLTLQ